MAIFAHQNNRMTRDEWLTPQHIIEDLGPFDLDPCAAENRPWPTAESHFTRRDNGLTQSWWGRVWLNPPYGCETASWVRRLARHDNGIALLFARTETKIFFPWVWDYATAVLFCNGRITFCLPDGTPAKANSGAPSVLVAYGQENARILNECYFNRGKFILLRGGE